MPPILIVGNGFTVMLAVPEPILASVTSSYYMYHIQTKDRDKLAKYLRGRGIYTTFRYYPLHLVKFFANNEKLKNTEVAANNTLCIPLHQSLSQKDVHTVIETIKEFK